MVGNRGYTRIVGLLPGTVYEAAVVALGDGETWSDSIIKDYLLFKTEVQKMSNQQFGAAQIGRAQTNGRFYAIPAANVAANVIYMPAYSTSPFFGIAEAPVPAGSLGAFATEGIFIFNLPAGWTSSIGQAVYWTPTSATTGALSATAASGSVRIGYEVASPGVDGMLCVYVQPGDALES